MSFEEQIERIMEVADVSVPAQLAKILGISPNKISPAGRKNIPEIWAYKIAVKYHVSPNWIIEGEQPKHNFVRQKYKVLTDIEKWLDDLNSKRPGQEFWFETEFRRRFDEFEKYSKRNLQDEEDNIRAV